MNNDLLDMKLQDFVADLSHFESFTYAIESIVRYADDQMETGIANQLMACLVMQETKIKEFITALDELENKVRKSNNDAIPTETLLKVFRGELPESTLDKYSHIPNGASVPYNGYMFTPIKRPKIKGVAENDSVYYEITEAATGESRIVPYAPDYFKKIFAKELRSNNQ